MVALAQDPRDMMREADELEKRARNFDRFAEHDDARDCREEAERLRLEASKLRKAP